MYLFIAIFRILWALTRQQTELSGISGNLISPAVYHRCRSVRHCYFCIPEIELPISGFFHIPLAKSLVLAV